jgi:four helix bundle protein
MNWWGKGLQPTQFGGMQPHHRSLLAWVEAREVSRAAYRACRDHWKPAAAAVFNQFQRAALSIRLNIAEGFALADFGRFGNHLAIAYGSAVETEECLDLMREEEILPEDFAAQTIERCQRCERLLLGLLKKYRPLGGSR